MAGQRSELLEELRGYIARDLRGGYLGHDELIDNALDVLDLQADEAMRVEAARILEEEIESYRSVAAGWPAVTDYNRLEQAFAVLEAKGVVCRQNFTCCGTCGAYEIGDEVEAARQQGGAVRGYAFFHMQDTESAVDGDGLYLNYGAVEEGESAAVAVGRSIADAFRAAGLAVDWDGDLRKRIFVALQWQRRLAL